MVSRANRLPQTTAYNGERLLMIIDGERLGIEQVAAVASGEPVALGTEADRKSVV